MDIKTATEVLKRHNKWRRGDDNYPMAEPRVLGEAIDLVLEHLQTAEYKPIKIETQKIEGIVESIEAMRLPMKGKPKKLSNIELATKLIVSGDEHSKFTRGIMVWFKISM